MKYLLALAVLAIILCSSVIEATSEPVCFYEELKMPVPRWRDFIHFKETKGCYRKVSCNDEYKTVIEECNLNRCPVAKTLDEKTFPDCCCY